MDFLDPDYKRKHNIILLVGQTLVAVAVLTAAILLVYKAYGYDVDRKTGAVVQNGLVYVDSAPSNAAVKVDDQPYADKTNTRFTLPAGSHTVRLDKDKYHSWQKSFVLSGSDVERFTYPTLFLESLTPQTVANDAVLTYPHAQSPDRKWLLFAENLNFTSVREYNLADLDKNSDLPKTRSVVFPATIFTQSTDSNTSFEVVEWSNNNANFLVKHSFEGKVEYALLSRDEPNKSFNFATLGIVDGEVALLDKSADTFLILNKTTHVLTQYDLKDKKTTTLLSGVVAYKSHGDNKILYAKLNPSDVSKYTVSVLDDKKNYDIRDIPATTTVSLDMAGFQNKMYMVIGSEKESKSYIYEDFVKKYKTDALAKPGPVRVMRSSITSPLVVGFSKNVRFISAFSGDDVSVYDIEKSRNYHYKLNAALPAGETPVWMDGHRLVYAAGAKLWVTDFDGSNKRELTPLQTDKNVFFDRDYNIYYTVADTGDTKMTLSKIDIRLKSDR